MESIKSYTLSQSSLDFNLQKHQNAGGTPIHGGDKLLKKELADLRNQNIELSEAFQ